MRIPRLGTEKQSLLTDTPTTPTRAKSHRPNRRRPAARTRPTTAAHRSPPAAQSRLRHRCPAPPHHGPGYRHRLAGPGPALPYLLQRDGQCAGPARGHPAAGRTGQAHRPLAPSQPGCGAGHRAAVPHTGGKGGTGAGEENPEGEAAAAGG